MNITIDHGTFENARLPTTVRRIIEVLGKFPKDRKVLRLVTSTALADLLKVGHAQIQRYSAHPALAEYCCRQEGKGHAKIWGHPKQIQLYRDTVDEDSEG